MTASTYRQRTSSAALRAIALLLALVGTALPVAAQGGQGTITGVVLDKDFQTPLADARVQIVELNRDARTSARGNYLLTGVPAGAYTLVFSKDGYVRTFQEVAVVSGQLTEANEALAGDFTEMEEFVVQDPLQLGGGTELALLSLRFESPALLDSVSSELMSRAGASDAEGALKLIAGASTKDGKSAVIRGLPDRYVSSQLNGVRLPSADSDKRAVELDQFPSAAIESVQVSKTFTPDQQGDASGGAVNIVLKPVPEERVFAISAQVSGNTQVAGRSDFLTYEGGGVSAFGIDDGSNLQAGDADGNWDGAVGTTRGRAPLDWKVSTTIGDRSELSRDWTVGYLFSAFYERDSSFYDNGVNDSYWADGPPGTALSPEAKQGNVQGKDFKTALFDVTEGAESVQWGGLATLGFESEQHAYGLTYLYTRTAESKAILAEDTRGKEYYVTDVLGEPSYEVGDPTAPGNLPDDIDAAPYLRSQTLEYTERSTDALLLSGQHVFGRPATGAGGGFEMLPTELSWRASYSQAASNQPDRRQFGSLWKPASFNQGAPPFQPPFTTDEAYEPFLPAASVNLGNLQRTFTKVEEQSLQFAVDLTFPFEQWQDEEGFLQIGFFDDSVDRDFDQDTFTNANDFSQFDAGFDTLWSDTFPSEDHPIVDGETAVDYVGTLDTSAFYVMGDLPLSRTLDLIAGLRFESNDISIVNTPQQFALYVDPNNPNAQQFLADNPGAGDALSETDDVLPALGLLYEPSEQWAFRVFYAETVARQTFKELSPVIQQEFVGGPVFIGNPDLEPASLRNYDVRADYRPYDGGLASVSWFYKDIEDAIEFVQVPSSLGFTFTGPFNYPKGWLTGFEFEVRQDLERFNDELVGLKVGGNLTLIDSEVTLRDQDVTNFAIAGYSFTERDLLAAPEYLYNLYLTYDVPEIGTQLGLFYTVQGDTLVAGAGLNNGNFVPDVYAKEVGTLNFSLSQAISGSGRLRLQLKNLTNPTIEEVYRSEFIEGETVKTSRTKGVEVSLGVSFSF